MMSRKKTIAIAIIFVLTAPSAMLESPAAKATSPRTIKVPDDFPTIQEALGNATAGDTVYVKAGNYTIPPVYEQGIEYGIRIGNSVTLKGENPHSTIIATTEQVNFVYEGYGILLYNDSEISGFTITGNLNVIGLFGNGRVTNNIINLTSNGRNAITATSGTISSNIINGGREGMANQNPGGGLVGGNTGIATFSLPVSTANTTISNNIINGFGSGIWVGGDGQMITNNTFTNNYSALTAPQNPSLLQGNNIVNSTAYALYAMINVNATYNWWGTTDAQKITTLITTGLHTADVTYIPFLTEPNPQAMPVQSDILSPTLTPAVPELSWTIIMPLLSALLSSTILLRLKKRYALHE